MYFSAYFSIHSSIKSELYATYKCKSSHSLASTMRNVFVQWINNYSKPCNIKHKIKITPNIFLYLLSYFKSLHHLFFLLQMIEIGYNCIITELQDAIEVSTQSNEPLPEKPCTHQLWTLLIDPFASQIVLRPSYISPWATLFEYE